MGYNFAKLEDIVHKDYLLLLKAPSESTRGNFFCSLQDLVRGVISVRSKKPDSPYTDIEKLTYEHSLYLFERIVIGRFRPVYKDKFPWQHYVRKAVRINLHTMYKDEDWVAVLSKTQFAFDTGVLVEGDVVKSKNLNIIDTENQQLLHDGLRCFYSLAEIKRLLPLSLDLITTNFPNFFGLILPNDLRDFCIIVVCLTKRIARETHVFNNKSITEVTLDEALKNSIRSTLFLAAISDSKLFPKELLLALDIDSLVRLAKVAGGRTLKIPTLRRVDTLIGSVEAASQVLLKQTEIGAAVESAKKNYNLIYSNKVNIKEFVLKTIDIFKVIGTQSESTPIMGMVLASINSLQTIATEFNVKLKEGKISPDTCQYYLYAISCFDTVANSLLPLLTENKKSKNE
tara:strand:+ start:1388 stop:2587 length:1200 start_codon:yes stop_codon:yes gene_type:complete